MTKRFTERNQLDLSQVNKDVLKEWDEKDIFHKSIKEREGCPSSYFTKDLLQPTDCRVSTM